MSDRGVGGVRGVGVGGSGRFSVTGVGGFQPGDRDGSPLVVVVVEVAFPPGSAPYPGGVGSGGKFGTALVSQ